MKRKISKKFLILIVSSVLISVSIILCACAGGDDFHDFFKSFFAPETSNLPESKPFFRSTHTFYGYSHYPNAVHVMDSTNLYDWKCFFESKVSTDDLNYMVYQSRIGEIDTCLFFIKSNSYPINETLKRNTILAFQDKLLVKDFLFYLGYAKRCEPYVTYVNDYWWSDNNKDPRNDSIAMNKLIQNGIKAMNRLKSYELKERYAFQIVRMFFHAGLYSDCIHFFEQNRGLFTTQNSIYFRTLGYVAASHYKGDEDNSTSNYLYSVIFDKCAPMRETCMLSFHPEEELDWDKTLSLANNTHEKEVLWHMLGIAYDPLRAMKEIYSLNPKSNLLDLLLVRAVNINEEAFIQNNSLFWWETDQDTSFALCPEKVDTMLLHFTQTAANSNNTNKPYLWNLATGYLMMANGQYSEANNYFSRALSGSTTDQLVNEQIRALRLIALIEPYNSPSESVENQLARELIWLKKDQHDPALRTECIYNWATCRLSEKYQSWGDPIKAKYLNSKQNLSYFDEISNIEAMIVFIDKPQKNDFEKFLISIQSYTKGSLYTYISILLTYQYQFKSALEVLQNHQDTFNEGFFANPFEIRINDCHDCDYKSDKFGDYSRVSFLKEIIGMEKEAELNPAKAAENYFRIANGLYNITYFGNCHNMYEWLPSPKAISCGYYWWSYDKPQTNNPFFDCSKAMEYYQKAMDASSDPEFRAKCCFMAAKCEQNQYYISGSYNYKNSIKSGKYFRQLQNDYPKTKYYQEVIKECGYFKKFINS